MVKLKIDIIGIMESMYEKLMELPIFQGVSRDKLSELIEKTPFHFIKHAAGDTIVSPGDNCTHIRFIISGNVRLTITNTNKNVSVSETISGPNVIGPDYLFGRDTCYPFSAVAETECGILQIIKSDFINILQSDKVFLFNMLNTLSRNSQKSITGLLAFSTGTLAERIAFLILSLTQQGGKDIRMNFKQKNLCALLGAQRSSLLNALNKLKEDNVIEYSLSEIIVTNRKLLRDVLHSNE